MIAPSEPIFVLASLADPCFAIIPNEPSRIQRQAPTRVSIAVPDAHPTQGPDYAARLEVRTSHRDVSSLKSLYFVLIPIERAPVTFQVGTSQTVSHTCQNYDDNEGDKYRDEQIVSIDSHRHPGAALGRL